MSLSVMAMRPSNSHRGEVDSSIPVSLPIMASSPALLAPSAERHGIDLIVHFGSTATGRANGESDLDIAIRRRAGAGRLAWEELCDLESEMARLLASDREIDLVDLGRAESLLLQRVAKTGRPLYEGRPGLFIDFQSYALRRFEDETKYFEGRRRRLRSELHAD